MGGLVSASTKTIFNIYEVYFLVVRVWHDSNGRGNGEEYVTGYAKICRLFCKYRPVGFAAVAVW
jgi:hypothetical protein